MSISRRGFLKGLCALSIAAYAPAVLSVTEVKPLPQKVIDYLGNLAELYGVARKPGESDTDLRSRILAKFNIYYGAHQ